MNKLGLIVAFLFFSLSLQAAFEDNDSIAWELKLEDVVVSYHRAGGKTPISYSQIQKQAIRDHNMASNLPYVLNNMPSIVAVSENGTPTGNTTMRIRGSSSSRINVTLNGMPINNPESQEMFWINLPSLSNSLQSVQVQRGVGLSANGAAAFGGAVNMQSLSSSNEPYGDISFGAGSYNTYETMVGFGTGKLFKCFSMDVRYSNTQSDGYVRNGNIDHQSLFTSLSYSKPDDLLKFVYIRGVQHTGITWEGAAPELVKQDRLYNPAGQYYDDKGKVHYYNNETDNYIQDVVQLLYTHQFSPYWNLNAGLSYVRGYGYYENYKYNKSFSNYGLDPQINDGTKYNKSDFIQQKLMDNDSYVALANLKYIKNDLSIYFGGMFNYYDGAHWGEILWSKYNQNITPNYEWYSNFGYKNDANFFAKATWQIIPQLSAFGDIQYRFVNFDLRGTDDDMVDLSQDNRWNFVNPRMGLYYSFNNHALWLSSAISHREPLRSDLKDANKKGIHNTIKDEMLWDTEIGYKFSKKDFNIETNLYYMSYKDQLVANGKISTTGYSLMENVKDSYRVGTEISVEYKPYKWLSIDANVTFSRNIINNYVGYMDCYDNPINWNQEEQVRVNKDHSTLSFSPDVVSSSILSFIPKQNLTLSFVSKYVSKQYYDNFTNPNNIIPAHFVNDFKLKWDIKLYKTTNMSLEAMINNLLNKEYYGNAWVYSACFADKSPDYVEKGIFVQAPRNYMLKLIFNIK